MRKLIASIIAILYLTASSGASVYAHYCMDKLVGVNLVQSTTTSCENCGMEKSVGKKSDCCKDQHKLIKLDNDQKANEAAFQLPVLLGQAITITYADNYIVHYPSSVTEEHPNSNSPPLSGRSITTRHCVFLI